jgi:mannosyl-3-phosphoglycerate phosphatase family protein
VENGGAIYIPESYFPFPVPAGKASGPYQVIELGVPYAEIVAKLQHAAELTGCSVRSFHEMSVDEVALCCHMSIRAAEFAKQREYDEPLDILSESSSVICAFFDRMEQEGLTWTRGGRFYHLRGRHNKGQAALALLDLYRKWRPDIISVGLGDGLNDISLLEAVDVPIVIPNAKTKVPLPAMLEGGGRVAEQPGPRGWNRAVLQVLENVPAGSGL